MRVAITFCDQPKHERRGNEHCYSSLSRCEAESLPHFIEFKTTAFLKHEYLCEFFSRLFTCGPSRTLQTEVITLFSIRRYPSVLSSVIRFHLRMDEANPKAVARHGG